MERAGGEHADLAQRALVKELYTGSVLAAADHRPARPASGTAAKLGVMLRRPLAGARHWRRGSAAPSRCEAYRLEGAADLQQLVGTALRPAHPLRFGHPAVHQEVGRAFGQRRADPQPGRCRSPSSQLRMKVESKVTTIASAGVVGLAVAGIGRFSATLKV